MTEQEAIEILKKNREYGTELSDAYDIAILALEKQIPKKVQKRTVILYLSEATDVLCPVCEKSVCTWISLDSHSKKRPYCPSCGQALDWSEK